MFWREIHGVWLSGQVGLPQVERWKKYRKKHPGVRRQDSLQHSHSLVYLGMIAVRLLRPYVVLDGELILGALAIHDHGEGELLVDMHYIDKTDDDDLNEYQAFVERFRSLPKPQFDVFHQAFLLQFAGRGRERFPPESRSIMQWLRDNKPMEVLAFEAIETWDYLLFAMEQEFELGYTEMMVQVLRNQMDKLTRYASELPGFRQQIWNHEVQAWARELLQQHEGKWIEQKGEK